MQTKNEIVLKTAGKLCNSGEAGHMHILGCKVAQQTQFMRSEAGGLFPCGTPACWAGHASCRSLVPQEPQPPLDGEGQGWAAVNTQRLQPVGEGCC